MAIIVENVIDKTASKYRGVVDDGCHLYEVCQKRDVMENFLWFLFLDLFIIKEKSRENHNSIENFSFFLFPLKVKYILQQFLTITINFKWINLNHTQQHLTGIKFIYSDFKIFL